MTVFHVPERLDMAAFAREAAHLQGDLPLRHLERLAEETADDGAPGSADPEQVHWQAQGEQRTVPGGRAQAWLHLQASTRLKLTCQRCLTPVALPVQVDRWFRFVDDEATALAQDDESEEDLLVLSPRFNLIELMEDELLMALPLVPKHEVCPATLPELQAPAEAADERPHPFAALAQLKPRGGSA